VTEQEQAQQAAERSASRLAHEAITAGDPTAWFERLYAAAGRGTAVVPWDRNAASPLLVQWAAERGLRGDAPAAASDRGGDAPAADVPDPARTALVVGCGLGDDAEFIAGLGFRTVAFDISPSAIRAARRRFAQSSVRYCVADLMAAPARWRHAYDLVVESMTLQALPDPPRGAAITSLSPLVAPGGTLIVFARGREPGSHDDGPPWSLTRSEIDAIAAGRLDPVRIDENRDRGPSTAAWRWRAEFRRPVQD
jgi:SAM-dependent methyltransferase